MTCAPCALLRDAMQRLGYVLIDDVWRLDGYPAYRDDDVTNDTERVAVHILQVAVRHMLLARALV